MPRDAALPPEAAALGGERGCMAPLSYAAQRADAMLREQGAASRGCGGGEVWARLALIHYLGNPGPGAEASLERVAGEVPAQLAALQCWPLLRDVVCSMPVFFALWSDAHGVQDLLRCVFFFPPSSHAPPMQMHSHEPAL